MPSVGSLEVKALSDLDLAQRMALRGPSGHGLGTAMFLAQQSLEKALKSAVIQLCEGAGLENGDGIAQSLGHQIYPRIVKAVHRGVARAEAQHSTPGGVSSAPPGARGPGADCAARTYAQVASLWRCFSGSASLQEHIWKISMGVGLEGAEMSLLRWWFADHADAIGGIRGAEGAKIPILKNPMFVPPAMEEAILDRRKIEALKSECAERPDGAARRARFRRGCEDLAHPGPRTRGPRGAALDPHGRSARRSVLELWFESIMSHHEGYMLVFPHNTLGRYPKTVSNGLATTDLYWSQIDYTLYHLFVQIPCHIEEIRGNSARLARLCGCGRGAGCR